MIELQNVSLFTPGFRNREPILLDANVSFGSRERVGILAAPGSGKSSLARLLSGIDMPDHGRVYHVGRVSWPINFAGYMHPDITVDENISMLARLVGVSPRSVAEFCFDRFGLQDLSGKTMKNVSPTQRALLSYSCAMSVAGPAIWIADETITLGNPQQRKICDNVLAERLSEGGLIFLSRNAGQLRKYCDRFLVLLNNRLVRCDDLGVAQKALDLGMNQARQEKPRPQYA